MFSPNSSKGKNIQNRGVDAIERVMVHLRRALEGRSLGRVPVGDPDTSLTVGQSIGKSSLLALPFSGPEAPGEVPRPSGALNEWP